MSLVELCRVSLVMGTYVCTCAQYERGGKCRVEPSYRTQKCVTYLRAANRTKVRAALLCAPSLLFFLT